MKKITKLLLLSLNFILIPNLCFAIKNETYLICKKEDDNLKQNLQNFNNKKIKENLHKNFSFYFLNNGKYIETAVKITFDEVNYKISIDITNNGKYLFEEEKILLIDDLKFRDRSNKKELSRDSLELISNYRGETQFVHRCELSSLENFKKKYSELIKGLEDIYKIKYENNKM